MKDLSEFALTNATLVNANSQPIIANEITALPELGELTGRQLAKYHPDQIKKMVKAILEQGLTFQDYFFEPKESKLTLLTFRKTLSIKKLSLRNIKHEMHQETSFVAPRHNSRRLLNKLKNMSSREFEELIIQYLIIEGLSWSQIMVNRLGIMDITLNRLLEHHHLYRDAFQTLEDIEKEYILNKLKELTNDDLIRLHTSTDDRLKWSAENGIESNTVSKLITTTLEVKNSPKTAKYIMLGLTKYKSHYYVPNKDTKAHAAYIAVNKMSDEAFSNMFPLGCGLKEKAKQLGINVYSLKPLVYSRRKEILKNRPELYGLNITPTSAQTNENLNKAHLTGHLNSHKNHLPLSLEETEDPGPSKKHFTANQTSSTIKQGGDKIPTYFFSKDVNVNVLKKLKDQSKSNKKSQETTYLSEDIKSYDTENVTGEGVQKILNTYASRRGFLAKNIFRACQDMVKHSNLNQTHQENIFPNTSDFNLR